MLVGTFPETNSSHLKKIDAWKTIFLLGPGLFSEGDLLISGRYLTSPSGCGTIPLPEKRLCGDPRSPIRIAFDVHSYSTQIFWKPEVFFLEVWCQVSVWGRFFSFRASHYFSPPGPPRSPPRQIKTRYLQSLRRTKTIRRLPRMENLTTFPASDPIGPREMVERVPGCLFSNGMV